MKRFFALCAVTGGVLTANALHGQTVWKDSGLGGLTIRSLAVNSNGDVFAGTADSGVYRSTTAGNSWQRTSSGLTSADVLSVVADHRNNLFAATYNGVFRSSDNAVTWINFGLENALHVSAARSGEIFVARALGNDLLIMRSTNAGSSWSEVASFSRTQITALTSSGGNIYAGIVREEGVVQLIGSTGNGKVWFSTGLWNDAIRDIVTTASNSILVATKGRFGDTGISRSTDIGLTWHPANTGLTNLQTHSLAANSSDHLFVGTFDERSAGGGIFRSTDNGERWEEFSSGLTDVRIVDLVVLSDGTLLAGTAGGGIFRTNHSTTSLQERSSQLPHSFMLEQNYPNPFNPKTSFKFNVPSFKLVTLKVFDLLGREVATLVNEELKPGRYEITWDASGHASGAYSYRLQAGTTVETKKLILVK